MDPLGLHAMVLTVGGDAEATCYAAEVAVRAGYDLLELSSLDPSTLDTEAMRVAASEHGLDLATSLGLAFDTDVSSTSTAAAGEDWMCGVLASALGKYPGSPSREGRNNAVADGLTFLDEVGDDHLRLHIAIYHAIIVDLDGFLAALADTLAIWRSPWTDGGPLAIDALAFLQARVKKSVVS